MEVRDYIALRRAYNLVRQGLESKRRVTFSEFAIICRLYGRPEGLKTSQIAEYQSSLRPTMTHRCKHLAQLGLISRTKGAVDHRNVECALTVAGRAYADEVLGLMRERLAGGPVLGQATEARVRAVVDAMGTVSCMSADLVILGIGQGKAGASTIGGLVKMLGLLQPTVSMAVSSLVEAGLVVRGGTPGIQALGLSEKGQECEKELASAIEAIDLGR